MLKRLSWLVTVLFVLAMCIPGSPFCAFCAGRPTSTPVFMLDVLIFCCTVVVIQNSPEALAPPIWLSITGLTAFTVFLVLLSNHRAAMKIPFEGDFKFAPLQALATLVTLGLIFLVPVWLCANIGSRWRRYTKPLTDLPMEE